MDSQSRLVSLNIDGQIELRNGRGEIVTRLTSDAGKSIQIRLDAHGQSILALTDRHQVEKWVIAGFAKQVIVPASSMPIVGLAMNPVASEIALVTKGGQLQQWRIGRQQPVTQFELRPGRQSFESIDYDSTGDFLLVKYSGNVFRLFNTGTFTDIPVYLSEPAGSVQLEGPT